MLGVSNRPFVFDRTFVFDVPTERFWKVIEQTDDYPSWWTWLRRFDADGLAEGTIADCEVRAPLPYSLRFNVEVVELVPGELLRAQVRGDLEGPARLEVRATDEGCAARLVWEVSLRAPLLRPAALVARPALHWAHDRIVDLGMAQFRRRALP